MIQKTFFLVTLILQLGASTVFAEIQMDEVSNEKEKIKLKEKTHLVRSITAVEVIAYNDFSTINDIEALAQEDGGKLTHCPNFKSQSVWIASGWISGSWHTCCVMGADIDACNFSLEDSQCKQWASRPAKPSNCL